ncbi:MAG: DUF502 domain-containing protein [Flavobacteriales bacterium]
MKNKYVKRFINFVLNGLLISLPVFGTGYIIYHLLNWLDGIVPHLLGNMQPGDPGQDAQLMIDTVDGPLKLPVQIVQDTPGGYSGIGILMLVALLFVLGWLGHVFINDRLKSLFEKLLDRIPGVNNIYHTISDILGAFVGNKKKFNQPVLVKVSEQLDLEMVGFITDTDLIELGDIKGKVAVYFPMSYSFAGHMLVVPVKNLKRIESNPVDIMKYTVSGGIVEFDPDDDNRKNK